MDRDNRLQLCCTSFQKMKAIAFSQCRLHFCVDRDVHFVPLPWCSRAALTIQYPGIGKTRKVRHLSTANTPFITTFQPDLTRPIAQCRQVNRSSEHAFANGSPHSFPSLNAATSRQLAVTRSCLRFLKPRRISRIVLRLRLFLTRRPLRRMYTTLHSSSCPRKISDGSCIPPPRPTQPQPHTAIKLLPSPHPVHRSPLRLSYRLVHLPRCHLPSERRTRKNTISANQKSKRFDNYDPVTRTSGQG